MSDRPTVEVVFAETGDPVRVEAGLRLLVRAAVRFSQERADPGHDLVGNPAPSSFPLLHPEPADAQEFPQSLLRQPEAGAGHLEETDGLSSLQGAKRDPQIRSHSHE